MPLTVNWPVLSLYQPGGSLKPYASSVPEIESGYASRYGNRG